MGGQGAQIAGGTRSDANPAPISSQQPTQRGQQNEQDSLQAYKDWQDLIDSLHKISEKLLKEEETRQETPIQPLIQLLSKELKRARKARDQATPQDPSPRDQLDRIETGIQPLRQHLNKTPPPLHKGQET